MPLFADIWPDGGQFNASVNMGLESPEEVPGKDASVVMFGSSDADLFKDVLDGVCRHASSLAGYP